jgi:putative tricarboxylic transport membrane protein
MNKAGGNQTLAPTYLRQHPGNPHFLLYSTSSIFTAQITGLIQQHFSDLTPIALMMIERNAISVAMDSPLFAKFLEVEYQASKAVLTELGFAKQSE